MYACCIDGALCEGDAATLPVDDHGLLYGDGVFEGLRFYDGHVFRLDAHLARLEASARALMLEPAMDRAGIADCVLRTVAAAGLDDGYVRLIVTRGSGSMGIDPRSCKTPRTIVIVDELVMVDPAARASGIKAIIASTRRLASDQLDPRIKSLNYLNQIMARLEAHAAGADEAIILNDQGRIAEGTADNVFVVRDGVLLTPPVVEGALDGITRNAILEVARAAGIDTREAPLTPWDLFNADECFLSGTGAELVPVGEISGRAIASPGSLYEQLSAAFRDLIAFEASQGAAPTTAR